MAFKCTLPQHTYTLVQRMDNSATKRFSTISKFTQYDGAVRKQSVFVRLKNQHFSRLSCHCQRTFTLWWVLPKTYRTAVSVSKGHEIYRHLKKRACAFGVKSSK